MYTFCNKFTFILHLIFIVMHIDSTTAYTVRTVLADFAVHVTDDAIAKLYGT